MLLCVVRRGVCRRQFCRKAIAFFALRRHVWDELGNHGRGATGICGRCECQCTGVVVASVSNAPGVARGSRLGFVGLFQEVCASRTTAFRKRARIWGDDNRRTVVRCCRVSGKSASQRGRRGEVDAMLVMGVVRLGVVWLVRLVRRMMVVSRTLENGSRRHGQRRQRRLSTVLATQRHKIGRAHV